MCLLGRFLFAVDLEAADALFDLPIRSLELRGDGHLDEAALKRLTDLTPGKPLTRAAVREALRNLFATRLFLDLTLQAERREDGVSLIIDYEAAPVIRSLQFIWPGVPETGKLRDALELWPGETWSAERAATTRAKLARLLQARGFYRAETAILVEPGNGGDVEITVRVEAGPRARTGAPEFDGETSPLTPEALAKASRAKPGKPYEESLARESAERFESEYRGVGRAYAVVRFEGARFDEASGAVHPLYSVEPGPHVILRVEGAPRSRVEKHPESPWVLGEPPDEEAIQRLQEAVRTTYQQSGYARADVQVARSVDLDAEGTETLTFTISRGARYTVSRVSFEGPPRPSQSELEGLVRTHVRGLLAAGRLVERDLKLDRQSLAAHYSSRGYDRVRVETPEVKDGPRPFTLEVTFRIDEGPETCVTESRIEPPPRDPTLPSMLRVQPGLPFNPVWVGDDVTFLRSFYADRGYLDALVEARVARASDGSAVDVVYSVNEGPRVTFGKTVVRGQSALQLSVVEREMKHREGEPFSLARLVETQQSLARLGVFQRVELSNFPAAKDDSSRTVLIALTEAKPWSLLYGVGAEYDDKADPALNPRLSLGISHANLFGRAIVGAVEGRYSRRDARFVASLKERSIFDSGIPAAFTIFSAKESRKSFDVRRSGLFLEAEKRFSPRLKATGRYQYEIVDPKEKEPGTLDRQNQAISISSIGPGLSYDGRDDPITPTSGVFLTADVKYAFSFLAANARFFKAFGQASYYKPLGRTTLAGAVRAGAIASLANCDQLANPACLPNMEVPIAERFFAGGRTTHRAFSFDSLGVPGQTIETSPTGVRTFIGGNALLLFNLEWRVPLVGDLGAEFFLDAGNVWASLRRIRLPEFRTGAGLGLSYQSPVGPIRIEYGFKLDREPEEPLGAFHFSVGYPF